MSMPKLTQSMLRLPLLAAALVFGASAANAVTLCEYAAFKPTALQYRLVHLLGESGVAVLPASYVSAGGDVGEDTGADLAVVRDSRIFGHLRMSKASAGATLELTVTDGHGELLATSSSDTYSCAGGWCRTSGLTTLIDYDGDSAMAPAALQISQEPTYGVRYRIFGEEAQVTSWRSQYGDRLEWIASALSDESAAVDVLPLSSRQRLQLAFASVPAVAPYLPVLSLREGTGAHYGRLVLKARIPHDIYDLVMDAAFGAGFYDIYPDVVIDSGARIVSVSQDPDLQRCFGW